MGPIDKIFGLFFGVFKGYVYFILIFTISTIIYPLDNWNKSFKSGNFVNQIIYGKDIIVDNFPKRQDYIDDCKKKIKKLSKWQKCLIRVKKSGESSKKTKWRMWYIWCI